MTLPSDPVAAARRVRDLRVELDPVQVPLGGGKAGEGRGIGLGGGAEALGQAGDRVAVAHPDGLLAIDVREQAAVLGDENGRGPVLALARRLHVPAQLQRHQLGAVADAEHGQAARPDRVVGLGRTLVVDGHGPARQDHGPNPAPLQLGERRVVRQQLRVDVELADAAGDQLGELGSEIQHRDHAGLGLHRSDRRIRGRAVRRRRVERDLQVGLDLGIVWREHAVAGIRRLAVHGLATVAGRLRHRLLLILRLGQ
jgi:hypothetical protein